MTFVLERDDTTCNAAAVGLAYDHIIESFGNALAELLERVPVEALQEVREELERRAARFGDGSMLQAVVLAMEAQGQFDSGDRADFEWAFNRGTGVARKAFARVAEGLPDK